MLITVIFFSLKYFQILTDDMFFALFSATIDVKRNIFDLCTDTKDCYLAVIEVTSSHTCVRMRLFFVKGFCVFLHV